MNNSNVNNNDNSQSFFQQITATDFQSLSIDIFPSLIYILLISLVTLMTQNVCDPNFLIIFRALTIIYTCFIIKGLFHSLLIKLNKMSITFYSMSISSCDVLLNLSYYTIIGIGYFVFTDRKENCFIQNTYMTCLIFYLLMIGFVGLSQILLDLCLVIISFPIMVYYCISDPHSFYSSYGINPEIVNNLPTVKADKNQVSDCVICVEKINEGEEIIVLRCNHYFHPYCIRQWLLQKVSCPMCRSENVI